MLGLHEDFKLFLHYATESSNLEKIAKENTFEPKITSVKEKNIQFIKTQYSLQFEDKLGGLKALIEFHKLLIDKL